MVRRIAVLSVIFVIGLLGSLGHTHSATGQLTATELFIKTCGGAIFGMNAPPDLIPELRVAAGNALAEVVTDARGQNRPIEIDLATTWEWAAVGPNGECRALGEALLTRIYVDPSFKDNPFSSPVDGLAHLMELALSPASSGSSELTKSRIRALLIICRNSIYGGASSKVVSRLLNVASGLLEPFSCNGIDGVLDGSLKEIREVVSESLTGAYLSQLGPISLAPNIEDPSLRSRTVCSELNRRIESGSSSESRLAAAKAYAQGNRNSSLPLEFRYDCLSDSDLLEFVKKGGIRAEAGIDVLARALSSGDLSNQQLLDLVNDGSSSEVGFAASIALGIRSVDNVDIESDSARILVNGQDVIREISNLTGRFLATTFVIPLAQSWAGQSMDSIGHCIRRGALGSCFLTRQALLESDNLSFSLAHNETEIQIDSISDTNFKVITDREIADFVLLDEAHEGLDLQPLSSTKPGGITTGAIITSFSNGMPLSNNPPSPSFQITNAMVHDTLLESGFVSDIEGALAERFELSSDRAHLIFWIRTGVEWNDGKPFTDNDVLFSASLASYCVSKSEADNDTAELLPFLAPAFTDRFSSDHTCLGLPAILNKTAFIAPGGNGTLETMPTGDDVIFGNRILPSSSPVLNGEAGDTIIRAAVLDSLPVGDDVLIHLDDGQIAVVWKSPIFEPLTIGLDPRFCCLPQHILADSFDSALTENDAGILLQRWNENELRESPNLFVGTGPFILSHFGLGADGTVIYRRNPRFWKVDENGGRLPKIEEFHLIDYAGRRDAALIAHLNGTLDTLFPSANDKIPLMQEASERGIEYFSSNSARTDSFGGIILNRDVHLYDESKEGLGIAFRNPEVSRAISQSLDRRTQIEEIFQSLPHRTNVGVRDRENDIVAPACPIGRKDSKLERFCEAYQKLDDAVSFNILSANSRLDRIGIIDIDGDGIRDIRAGFGFIVPGLNGVLESEIRGDDFIMAGFEYSGLGLSDRDGDGIIDQDSGIIQPGPNGILDTLPSGDDVVEITSRQASLEFSAFTGQNSFPGVQNEFDQILQEGTRAIGVLIKTEFLPSGETGQRLLRSNPPELEAAWLSVGSLSFLERLNLIYDSCAFAHVYHRSQCKTLEARAPYQVRIDEIAQLAQNELDRIKIAELEAELQLLQAANQPILYYLSERISGSVRRDRVNATAGLILLRAALDVAYRVDLQDP